jgi:transcriptional regulator with XRE-family HTH domain
MNDMSPSDMSTGHSIEVGKYLAQLRERAQLKQAELARKITWSAAVLSRVEAGERPLAAEELSIILDGIGTPEAHRLSEMLARHWTELPRPPLDHPDQDLLWEAEKASQELAKLRERPDVRHAFERRLSEYLTEIRQAAEALLKREHQIAFIGSIGIGKSTAICRLTGLEVPGGDGGAPTPVLEVGGGGITICEVHLRSGPAYGVLIEPRSDDEIRADVTDFAEHLRSSDAGGRADGDDADRESQGISKEVERAIRNMSGLKVRREKGEGGKTVRLDDAKKLSQDVGSLRELVVEVLSRMELHRRDSRAIWYDSSSGKRPLEWLKDTFERINNGRQPDVTLPKRIEIVVPEQLLRIDDLSVRIIDTKGIDRTAARADLEGHLYEPHTLAVLCSNFNNAPAAEPALLLQRATEVGVTALALNASLLVLPRPNEALAVKDESGMRVESTEEGYELKAEQIAMALEPLGLRNLPVEFFNSFQDEPARLRIFLAERLSRIRQGFRDRISEITADALSLLANHEQAQAQEVLRAAANMLKSWASRNATVPKLVGHVQDSLMQQISQVYASTLRAAVRREGEWHNLSYTHHLGYGARRLAALALGSRVESFSEHCATLAGNPDYSEAVHLIQQADRLLKSSYEDVLRKMQLMGQTAFRDQLKSDATFWLACEQEWGQGPGYKTRVSGRNNAWFTAEQRLELESELRSLIEREWEQALRRVTALFEDER